MAAQTLHSYLNRRYFAIAATIFALFTFLIGYLALGSMDESSEYYMFYEAEVLTEKYPPMSEIEEFDPGFKEYYWGTAELPPKYRQLLGGELPKLNQLSYHSRGETGIYLLPYALEEAPGILYVIHIFPDIGSLGGEHPILSLLLPGSVAVLLALMLYIYLVNRRTSRAVEQLGLWVGQLGGRQLSHQLPPPVPDNLNFDELRETARILHESLSHQHHLHRRQQQILVREQEFLSALSHELRTPIAVIGAALDLLATRDDLPDTGVRTLAKIQTANLNMKSLTQSLLQLWRKQPATAPGRKLAVAKEIELAREQCCQLYPDTPPDIQVTINDDPRLTTQPTLLRVLLNNLLRNACQYGLHAPIAVTLENDSLLIVNAKQPADDGLTGESEYGYGLGLYLVEQICLHNNWHCTIDNAPNRFGVTISFAAPHQ